MIFSETNRKTPHFKLTKMNKWKRYRLEVYSTNKIGDSNRTELEKVDVPSILTKSKNSSDIGMIYCYVTIQLV